MKALHSIFILGLMLFINITAIGQDKEQLIVFIQDGALVSDDFMNISYPELERFAKNKKLGFGSLMSKKKERQQKWSFTPMLVYQNERGRSYFKGRYKMLSKIKNFIRTVKRVPQEENTIMAGEHSVWKSGRTKTKAKVKLTPLAGALPSNFDQDKFIKEGKAWIKKGFDSFKTLPKEKLSRNDRTAYMNFYPYRSADGGFSISMEIFSMFNCVDPVYVQFDQPITGDFKKRKQVFCDAAKFMEKEVLRQMNDLKRGDGFELIAKDIPLKSWSDLSLSLPEKLATDQNINAEDYSLAQNWEVFGPVDDITPMIQFAFLPPVDHYSGELKELRGSLVLSDDLSFREAKGDFSAVMNSLTMGDDQLDEHVLHDFKAAEIPLAGFKFLEITEADGPIEFGKTSKLSLKGEINFLNIKEKLNVTAQIEPIIDENENIFLSVYCSFQLRLKERFGIEGPDGPDPQNDTVVFHLNFFDEEAIVESFKYFKGIL